MRIKQAREQFTQANQYLREHRESNARRNVDVWMARLDQGGTDQERRARLRDLAKELQKSGHYSIKSSTQAIERSILNYVYRSQDKYNHWLTFVRNVAGASWTTVKFRDL